MSIRNLCIAVLMLTAALLTFMALLAMPNEYEAMGQAGVDCDGPASVLVFALPGLAVNLLVSGIIITGSKSGKRARLAGIILCLVISGALGSRIALSVAELQSEAHQETCSAGL